MSPVTVDAEELIIALEGGGSEIEYYVDRQTGEVFPLLPDSDEAEADRERVEADSERFVYVEPLASSVGWDVMEQFVISLQPGEPRRILERAITSRRPFRAFKDELLAFPDLREAWFAFHDQAFTTLAKEWLEDEGIDATLKVRLRPVP